MIRETPNTIIEDFSKVVDGQMTKLVTENNLSKSLGRFTDILNTVAEVSVGKTKLQRKTKPWITLHVRAKIRTRN